MGRAPVVGTKRPWHQKLSEPEGQGVAGDQGTGPERSRLKKQGGRLLGTGKKGDTPGKQQCATDAIKHVATHGTRALLCGDKHHAQKGSNYRPRPRKRRQNKA